MITGYQAQHTLGRKMLERWEEAPIFGDMTRLRAKVVKLNALSGHADQRELLAWLKPLAPKLKKIFLVHGESDGSEALKGAIEEMFGVETHVPRPGDVAKLD